MISIAGSYYLTKLILRMDYLYFMKDDIYWPDSFNIDNLRLVKHFAKKDSKHISSFFALFHLMQLEFQMFREIKNESNKPGGSKIIQQYINNFSSRRTTQGKGTFLFTERMYNHYIQYLRQTKEIEDYSASVLAAKKSVEEALESFHQLEEGVTN